MSTTTARVIKGVVFDMDGTLTVPVIDFALMRERVGIPPPADILDVISCWPEDKQKAAHDAIWQVEQEALSRMQVMPGAVELCSLLDDKGVKRALVTRNVQASVEFFHKSHFDLPPFFPALSREWTPYKPSPAALLHIAEQWGVDATELIMIGDSAKDDIVCGNRAGAVTILLDVTNRWTGRDDETLQGELRPTYFARSLHEVAELLRDQGVLRLEQTPIADAVLSEDSV